MFLANDGWTNNFLDFQREKITAEMVMIERMFIQDEKNLFQAEKKLAAESPGKRTIHQNLLKQLKQTFKTEIEF